MVRNSNGASVMMKTYGLCEAGSSERDMRTKLPKDRTVSARNHGWQTRTEARLEQLEDFRAERRICGEFLVSLSPENPGFLAAQCDGIRQKFASGCEKYAQVVCTVHLPLMDAQYTAHGDISAQGYTTCVWNRISAECRRGPASGAEGHELSHWSFLHHNQYCLSPYLHVDAYYIRHLPQRRLRSRTQSEALRKVSDGHRNVSTVKVMGIVFLAFERDFKCRVSLEAFSGLNATPAELLNVTIPCEMEDGEWKRSQCERYSYNVSNTDMYSTYRDFVEAHPAANRTQTPCDQGYEHDTSE
ncbi:hypothetical protein Bbelb_341530 [Branchiostoma belcheri]|nr:hypothetical protein Bbelb_341530 [Branchiostoma belcheri]